MVDFGEALNVISWVYVYYRFSHEKFLSLVLLRKQKLRTFIIFSIDTLLREAYT